MPSDKWNSNVKIELTTSPEDWEAIRECYVRSFYHYPLYKYMVPEESKREEFLRAYLDANYEVTVGSGQGIMLALRVPDERHAESDGNSATLNMKVVGGVMLVPPSSDGRGWAIESDEPFWQAYEKHGLDKISKGGLERVKRYEAWENKHIAKKASQSRFPLWNGFFCAIAPEYVSKGLGTRVYKEAVKIMIRYWVASTHTTNDLNSKVHNHISYSKASTSDKQHCMVKKLVTRISQTHLTSPSNEKQKKITKNVFLERLQENRCKRYSEKASALPADQDESAVSEVNVPMALTISHSEKSAHFHQSNGFHPASRLPFYDEVEDVTPFYVHVLFLDPFGTGKLQEMIQRFQKGENC